MKDMSGDAPEKTKDDQRQKSFFVLVSKLDRAAPIVLFFPYPSSVQLERPCPAGYEVREVPASDADLRMSFTFTKRFMYNAIRQVFNAANIRKSTTTTSNWNIFWGHHLKSHEFSLLLPFQRVNHFPGSFELGRKDRLCGHLLRMKKKHPGAYSGIIPETYLTANEYDKQQFLLQFHTNPQTLWILKPPNLSCGRGIRLLAATSHATPKLSKKKAYVAQRYIANPFLINELKFDLRIYVLVTSYDPLRIYLYDDGLVRFCTEKYSTTKSGLRNRFGHLTNYSVNKKNTAAFVQNNDEGNNYNNDNNSDDEEGASSGTSSLNSSKWSLQMLFKFLREQGKSKELADFQIALEDLIIKTFLAVESNVLRLAAAGSSNSHAGFELYGFDILLEGEEMRPWLLEVNVFPSLSSSSPMDKRIKTILVCDVFQLVGIPFQDPNVAIQQLEREKQERLHGVKRRKSNPSGVGVGVTKPLKKTVEELLKKTHQGNFQNELDDDDLQIVTSMQEEELRKGHFKRIFPTSQAFEKYSNLFETQRYRNLLCMLWLQQINQDTRRRSQSRKN